MSAAPPAANLQSPNVSTAAPASEPAQRPHVTVRGLSKRFDKAIIYNNFDLDIPRGELISVFGPNGCGKSTLINMIAGLVPPDAGQILFDGRRLDYQYDLAGRLSRMESPDETWRTFHYDPLGNLIREKSSHGDADRSIDASSGPFREGS